MGAVFFYELQGAPLETTLPMLLDKARGQGWRVLVRGTDPALLAQLDAALWQGPVDHFLPHGLAGGPHDADQPILLGDLPAAGFACVMAVGGAAVSAEEALLLARACILFDSAEHAKAQARLQWKTLTDAGIAAQYWAQEDGRWVKKAERDARSAGG
ncbi:DNA polymerase III subunit chi [Yoonia vestfoldensis]|jgi:DNA polymerase-3 subunit chi|uniref:DNA polymerase III, chi subunit, putative n=1 Tax=Yoonia vestfoldensis SKA53 TaxID=314232 RepID=A3V6E0_9RHOB|nr:DNA polymerase III subunit chi [Yoonia vestfoldensis]EAQ06464.1 DNA polymerase III, chi subunit, putative [Yoonia vestfoldensis SKA53]